MNIELREYDGPDRVLNSFEIRDEIKNQPEGKKYKTGIQTLDQRIDGFMQGELVIISGPTGHGKTSLMRTATYKLQEQEVNPLWFSYELGHSALQAEFEKMGGLPFYYGPLETKFHDVRWLEQRIEEAILKYQVEFIIIDHLHALFDLMRLTNASLQIGAYVRKLVTMAVEKNICIVSMCHMTKFDPATDNEPGLKHFRDSGIITSECHTALMIWRSDEQNNAKIKVCKARRTGRIFDGNINIQMTNDRHLRETIDREEPEEWYQK